jgi:hypothetical protein
MRFLGFVFLVNDPEALGFGAGAGPGDEPAKGQGSLRRVAEPLHDHGCPQGQNRGAVDADRGSRSHRATIAHSAISRDPALFQ